MAAHAAQLAPASIPTPAIRRRQGRRSLWVIAVVALLVLTFGNLGALGATAHAVCTFGTAPGTTCGEALWLLGYP